MSARMRGYANTMELHARAHERYRESLAAGRPLTGRGSGEEFGRSDRWGRARIQEFHKIHPATAASLNGSEPDPEPASGASAGRAVSKSSGRFVVWVAFLLGIGASIAANVAHAQPEVGPRIAAAFAPASLLLAVECMSRPAWRRTGWQWRAARYGGTGLVALVAAVLSYRHMSALLLRYGEDPFNAAIGPLAVDGLMIVAGFALLAMNDEPTPLSRLS